MSTQVDQYYYHHVQHILTSMVLALDRVPTRKFTYVEQAYFQRWWRQQTPHMKNLTHHLIASKRLEFANGGWCTQTLHNNTTQQSKLLCHVTTNCSPILHVSVCLLLKACTTRRRRTTST